MNKPRLVWDLSLSEALKRDGMAQAASNRKELMALARAYAREYAFRHGECHADIVGRWLKLNGLDDLGPAAGSLFRGEEWVFTGRFKKSSRVKNHARLLRVWRLK